MNSSRTLISSRDMNRESRMKQLRADHTMTETSNEIMMSYYRASCLYETCDQKRSSILIEYERGESTSNKLYFTACISYYFRVLFALSSACQL